MLLFPQKTKSGKTVYLIALLNKAEGNRGHVWMYRRKDGTFVGQPWTTDGDGRSSDCMVDPDRDISIENFF